MMKLGFMLPEVLKGFYKSWVLGNPDTVLYPFEKLKVPRNFRGKLSFDPSACVGCKACVRDCPCEAIEIHKIGEKQFGWTHYVSRCCRCAQCVEVCPKKCLKMTEEFETASGDPEEFILK